MCNKNKQETIHLYFIDCTMYDLQRKILKQNIQKLNPQLEKLTNRKLIQIIQGDTIIEIPNYIYKNIYQFVKLYIVTTGRFAT